MAEILITKAGRSKFTQAEKIIHDQFVLYGRNAREWTRKCALLLPKIAATGVWRKKGFNSIYEYAAKLAGMSHYAVDDALRILKKIEDKPELQKVVGVKGLNAVRPIVAIASHETAGFWAEKALEMSRHTLETYVREVKKTNMVENFLEAENPLLKPKTLRTGPWFNTKIDFEKGCDAASDQIENKKVVAIELEPEILQQLEKLKGKNSWNDLMKQLLQIRAEKFEEEKPEAVESEKRYIPAKIKKFVFNRTNGQCAFPGCIKPSNILHHTQRWAVQKFHDPNQLYGLCKAHERIAHLGLIQNEEQKPQNWRVRNEADKTDPKYQVDLAVQKYRLAG